MKHWNLSRIVRLLLAVAITIYAFAWKDYSFLFLSALLLAQALLNVSCCGSNCSSEKTTTQPYKDIIKPYKRNEP